MSTLPACCTSTRRISYSRGVELYLRAADLDDAADEIDRKVAGLEQRPLALALQAMAQSDADAREKLLRAEWLGDIVVGAFFERLDDAHLVGAARQDHDRRLAALLPPLSQEFVALSVREAEVEDDEIRGRIGENDRLRLAAIGGLDHLVALRGKARPQEPADRRLIVDDEDADRGCAHATSSSCDAGADDGSAMVKTAPVPPERLAAVIVPPMASTKPRQMARPRPVPARTLSPFRTR